MKKSIHLPRFIFLSMLLIFVLGSCQEEIMPSDETRDPTSNEIGDYLVFNTFTKINGELPAAPVGDLKINQSDTLYVMKDQSYQARIGVKHEPSQNVAGFNIHIKGLPTAYYYQLPEVMEEGSDSVAVVYMGFDPPADKVEFPYTVEIVIQPHDPSGSPLDEFTRFITVEDPEDPNKCNLMDDDSVWEWLYTEMHAYQGDGVIQINAPWFRAYFDQDTTTNPNGYYYMGCCIDDPAFGMIEAYYNDPVRDGLCNEASQYLRKLWINTSIYLRAYEYLFMFKSGKFIHYSGDFIVNYNPQKSSLCHNRAYYDRVYTDWTDTGTHDYTQGEDEINLTTEVSIPAFGPSPPSGKIIYTCHLLIFTSEIENKIIQVYQRFGSSPIPDPMDYLHRW